jgi:hypothetical protein
MTRLSITDAALEGLHFMRRQPRAIAQWTLLFFLAQLLGVIVAVAAAWPELADFLALPRAADAGAGAFDALERKSDLASLVSILPMWAAYIVVYVALLRAILAPEPLGGRYVRWGKAETNQLLLSLLGFFTIGVPAIGAMAIGAAMVAALWVRGTEGLAVAVAIALALGFFGVLLWIAVRLCLAGPLSFDKGKVLLFEAWPLTRHRFWPLVGTYALALLIGMAVAAVLMIALIIFALILAAVGFGVAAAIGEEALRGMRPGTAFAIVALMLTAYLVVNAFMTAVSAAILMAPLAHVYKQLARTGSTERR